MAEKTSLYFKVEREITEMKQEALKNYLSWVILSGINIHFHFPRLLIKLESVSYIELTIKAILIIKNRSSKLIPGADRGRQSVISDSALSCI